MTFVPLLGVIAVLLLKRDNVGVIRWTSAFFSFIPLVASFFLLAGYDWSTSTIQFIERYEWFPQVNINYSSWAPTAYLFRCCF
jgi:NADH-quinone oxidoreductase subunit M